MGVTLAVGACVAAMVGVAVAVGSTVGSLSGVEVACGRGVAVGWPGAVVGVAAPGAAVAPGVPAVAAVVVAAVAPPRGVAVAEPTEITAPDRTVAVATVPGCTLMAAPSPPPPPRLVTNTAPARTARRTKIPTPASNKTRPPRSSPSGCIPRSLSTPAGFDRKRASSSGNSSRGTTPRRCAAGTEASTWDVPWSRAAGGGIARGGGAWRAFGRSGAPPCICTGVSGRLNGSVRCWCWAARPTGPPTKLSGLATRGPPSSGNCESSDAGSMRRKEAYERKNPRT